jgi:hypothetical protein
MAKMTDTKNSDKAKASLDGIESLRLAIANIKAEIDWLITSPIPHDSLRERVKSHIDNMAQAYVVMAPLMSIPAPGSGIEATKNFLNYGISEAMFGRSMTSELMCFVMGDTLVEKICAAVDANGLACGPALPERKANIDKLKQELLDLECREEDLICQAEDVGFYIARREDADPAAVLGYDPKGTMPILRVGYAGGRGSAGVAGDRSQPAAVVQNI